MAGIPADSCSSPNWVAFPLKRSHGLEEIDEAEAKQWLRATIMDEDGRFGKVEPKRTAPEPVRFEARRWRQFVFGPALVFVSIYVAFAVWRIVNAVRYPDLTWPYEVVYGLFLLAVVLVAALLSLFWSRRPPIAIALTGAKISGRRCGLRRDLSTLSLDELDRERSARRSLAGRVLGWQCLYSKNGGRIVIARRYFDGETVRGLFDRLGISSQ